MDKKTGHRGTEAYRAREVRESNIDAIGSNLPISSLSVSVPLWPTEIRYKRMVWLCLGILACIGEWGCGQGEDILYRKHSSVLRQAENLNLPISMSPEKLEALERMGPLLDSVRLEMNGTKELREKIQNILRGLELLRSDTLHTKPGMEAFRGTWDAIKTSWGGAARILPTDATVALAAVETSFRSASNAQCSASGLWQLLNPKPPRGAQEKFERPVT